AGELRAPFAQPFLEPPGLGDVPGFARLPVCVPGLFQTTVLRPFPPAGPFSNLAVPGFTLEDALTLRVAPPLVRRDDAKQTAANLILGLPELLRGGEGQGATQLDRALRQRPAAVILAVRYPQGVEAAVGGCPEAVPDAESFCGRYARLLAALREAGAEVLVMTVPDPVDSAYFSTAEAAAACLAVPPGRLTESFGLCG